MFKIFLAFDFQYFSYDMSWCGFWFNLLKSFISLYLYTHVFLPNLEMYSYFLLINSVPSYFSFVLYTSLIQTLLYFIVFHISLRSCFFDFPSPFLTPETVSFQKLFESSLIHNFFYLFNSFSFLLSSFIYIISICFCFYKFSSLLEFSCYFFMSFLSFGISH